MAIDHPEKALAASKREGEIHEFKYVDTGHLRGSFAGSFGHTSRHFDRPGATGGRAAKTGTDATAGHSAPSRRTATIGASRTAAESGAANVYCGGIERGEYRCGSDGRGRRYPDDSEERNVRSVG